MTVIADLLTVILFIVCVIIAGVQGNKYWLVCFLGMLGVLGVCELWALKETGMTLSQQQNAFVGTQAVLFNGFLLLGLVFLFIHLNWKRIKNDTDRNES